ncbi:MAG TPA: glycosyltransferase [Chitinophagaceae bacterium]|nr:glycosyltransferase [Chitinophagaceae bacterium]
MKLSVVIPVFNSQETIQRLVYSLFDVLKHLQLEVVLVNDGSKDKSESICEYLASENENVQFISLRKNSGEHNAVICGLNYCTGDYVAIIDDDLQNPPSEIISLLNRAITGKFDVVYAEYKSKQHSPLRNFYSFMNNAFAVHLLNKPVGLYLSSFKIIKKDIIKDIISYKGPYPYIDALVLRCTDNIGSQKVLHERRANGKSNYTLKKLISLYLNMVINFSHKPLRFITILGCMISVVSFIATIYVLLERIIIHDEPAGWSFLAILLLLLIGAVFVVIGILGEYIGKILMSLNGAPQYIIKKKVNTVLFSNDVISKEHDRKPVRV